MTMGLSRDDAGRFLPDYVDEKKAGMFPDDPFQSLDIKGVGMLIRMGHRERPVDAAETEGGDLRRARGRRGQREVLPSGGHGLRERVTVPCSDCAAGSGAGRD